MVISRSLSGSRAGQPGLHHLGLSALLGWASPKHATAKIQPLSKEKSNMELRNAKKPQPNSSSKKMFTLIVLVSETDLWFHELHLHTHKHSTCMYYSCPTTNMGFLSGQNYPRWSGVMSQHIKDSCLPVGCLGDGPLLSLRYQGILKWGKCISCNPWISLATN